MSLFKEAQSSRKPPRRPKPQMVAYPDYTKSLVTQRRQHPVQAGLTRAGQTGLTAAVLGALVARLMSDKPQHIAAGALAGGAVGAVPGFVSGKREAESDYSKLLFLRRRAVYLLLTSDQAQMTRPAMARSQSPRKSARRE